jgi:hypothetical protein
MNIENISKFTGKITAKTLVGVKSAPGKTGNRAKSIKDAFSAGFVEVIPAKDEVVETEEVDLDEEIDMNAVFNSPIK